MNDKLSTILKATSFSFFPGTYVYTKVRTAPERKHFVISQDVDEITVVTTKDRLSELDLIERNKDDYILIELRVSVPFYSVGFLATVTTAIAARGLNVLVVSTYSKDYVMVKAEYQATAREELVKLGMQEV